MNSRPQPYLYDWAKPINGQMFINYMPGPVLNNPSIKLKTTLLDEGGNIIGASNNTAARVYNLRAGINQFTVADALQLQNLILTGNTQNLLQSTGRLKAGQYQLMVEVTNMTGDRVLAKQTRPFFITAFQLPILVSPAKEAELDAHIAQNTILFRWTNLVPSSQELPVFRIQIFEILPGQTPMQAFRGNRPLVNEQVLKGTTQYIWRPNLPMLDSTANQNFIWTIQTFDSKGFPILTSDITIQGRSEPATFSIVNQKSTLERKRKIK